MNLVDLQGLPDSLRMKLFKGRMNIQDVVEVDKNKEDEVGVGFLCSVLTAAKVIDLARSEARKYNETPIRAYLKRNRVWERVPKNALLTLVDVDGVILNPEFFSTEVSVEDLAPPKPVNLLQRKKAT